MKVQTLWITEMVSFQLLSNTKSVPISIQIKDDDINEGNETFKVRVITPPR